MRHTPCQPRLFALVLTLLACSASWSQTPAQPASAATPATASTAQPAKAEQRIERIHVEDKATAIDEVRVGGQTQSIDVQPKNGMPAYQVSPSDGQRSWKVLGF